jgi:hypothetical protein
MSWAIFGLRASAVDWPPTRQGSRRSDPAREAGARPDDALFAPVSSSPHSIAMRPRAFVDERRVVAGDVCGRETLIQSPGQCGFRSGCRVMGFGARAAVARAAANGARLPRSIRFARRKLERINAFFTPASSSPLHCNAPARRGVFGDERRVTAPTRSLALLATSSSARRASPSDPLGQGDRQIHLPELLFQPRHGLEPETAEVARDLVLPTEWEQ